MGLLLGSFAGPRGGPLIESIPNNDAPRRDRRALLVGVQKYLDPGMGVRPGTIEAIRLIAAQLADPEGGAWEVEVLLDDETDEHRRPMLANLLERLQWLHGADEALLLISGRVRSGLFLPRDARPTLLARTAISLGEIAATLPKDASVIIDAPVDAGAFPTASWVLAAGPRDAAESFPTPRGPTAFLAAVARALKGEPAVTLPDTVGASEGPTKPAEPEVVTAKRLAEQVVRTAWPAWMRGERDLQLVRPSRRTVTCVRCAKPITDPLAAYCPACGHPMKGPETLEGGRYRLIRPLGTGGMGTVYLAEDTRLRVQRALKLITLPVGLPASEQESLRARLIQECKAAQALAERTGHCVRVFDVGHSPERGEPFLVMELLQGRTLGQKLAEGRLDLRGSLTLGKTLAGTLGLAHDQNIVHRDFKPDNVFLHHRSADEPEYAKLLDFGLAKVAEADVKTQTGRLMGTLQYMPPEQLRGEQVDARADVFALGAVLYECVSGMRAVPGKTQAEIFQVLLDKGVASLRVVAPHVPPALIELVDRCLALDPARRPANGNEVAAALAEIEAQLDADVAATPAAEAPQAPDAATAAQVTESPTAGARLAAPVHTVGQTSVNLPTGELVAPVAPLVPASARGAAFGALVLLGVAMAIWLGSRREEPAFQGAVPSVAPETPTPSPDGGVDAGPPRPRAESPPTQPPPERPWSLTWPDAPAAEAESQGEWIVYRGDSPDAQWARLVVDLTLADTPPPSRDAGALARWARMARPVRAWLSRGVDPETPGLSRRDPTRLTIRRDVFTTLAAAARPSETDLPGLGRLLSRGRGEQAEAVFDRVRCGEAREGDRLFTAEWSTPGYTPGRCAGTTCPERLARGLLEARENGETAQVKLELIRDDARGQPIERLRGVCRVAP
jgi:serine/threonine-protein kinase